MRCPPYDFGLQFPYAMVIMAVVRNDGNCSLTKTGTYLIGYPQPVSLQECDAKYRAPKCCYRKVPFSWLLGPSLTIKDTSMWWCLCCIYIKLFRSIWKFLENMAIIVLQMYSGFIFCVIFCGKWWVTRPVSPIVHFLPRPGHERWGRFSAIIVDRMSTIDFLKIALYVLSNLAMSDCLVINSSFCEWLLLLRKLWLSIVFHFLLTSLFPVSPCLPAPNHVHPPTIQDKMKWTVLHKILCCNKSLAFKMSQDCSLFFSARLS